MRYLIQMTLSGSSMFILYLVVKFFFGKRMSNRGKQLMLKAVVLFYLMPLTALNQYLADHVDTVRKVFQDHNKVIILGEHTGILYRTSNGPVMSRGLQVQIFVAAVWGIVALGILTYEGISHLRLARSLGRLTELPTMAETEIDLNEVKKVYGVKGRIKVCRKRDGDKQAFTLGCIRPAIFCLGDMSKEEKELVYIHEVIHIKRGDVFWKILMECVCLVHWVNPLVWWLRKELEFVSEEACDDIVLKSRGKRERELYATLLLEFAKGEPIKKGWSIPLSKKNKRLQERIENAMREKTGKKVGRFISLGAVVAAVMVNSLTALAFGTVQEVYVPWEEDDSSHWGEQGEFIFVQDGATAWDFEEAGFEDWDMPEYDFLYDFEFVDKNGNIYSVEKQDAVLHATCQHQYVFGTAQKHVKDANGGCTITQYEASRCSLCGYVVLGEKINTLHYDVCIH